MMDVIVEGHGEHECGRFARLEIYKWAPVGPARCWRRHIGRGQVGLAEPRKKNETRLFVRRVSKYCLFLFIWYSFVTINRKLYILLHRHADVRTTVTAEFCHMVDVILSMAVTTDACIFCFVYELPCCDMCSFVHAGLLSSVECECRPYGRRYRFYLHRHMSMQRDVIRMVVLTR